MNLGEALKHFFAVDDDAKAWGGLPDDFRDAPDCDVMSERLAGELNDLGFVARVVQLSINSAIDPLVGPDHWVVECEGLWIDWTARQFHNAIGHELEADEIMCPTIFLAGSTYHPIPTLILEEI